jgi:hypothetical protein
VHRILVRNGMVDKQAQQHKRAYRRWQRQEPMHLWQLDIVGGVPLDDDRSLKMVTGIDDHSRFVVIAAVVAVPSGRAVCAAFTAAMRGYGVPSEVLSDNGAQFTGRHTTKSTDEPAPSLHPITGASPLLRAGPPADAATVLNASRFLPPGALPLATPGRARPSGQRYRRPPSHVPCRSRRPDSRRLYAGHHLANRRAPARPIPGPFNRPGFDVIYLFRRLIGRFARARLPGPHLTHHVRLFLDAHHDGLQPTQLEVV